MESQLAEYPFPPQATLEELLPTEVVDSTNAGPQSLVCANSSGDRGPRHVPDIVTTKGRLDIDVQPESWSSVPKGAW